MAAKSEITTDHKKIRKWVEERGGSPAAVKGAGSKDEPGDLRIDFSGYSGEQSLEHIEWEDFFDKFEQSNLAFLYQDEMRDGSQSRFFKFVSRSDEQ